MTRLTIQDLAPEDRESLLGQTDDVAGVSPELESRILLDGSRELWFDAAVSHAVSEAFLGALFERVRGEDLKDVVATNPNAPLQIMGAAPICIHSDYSIQRFVERQGRSPISSSLADYLLEERRTDSAPLREVLQDGLQRVSSD